MVRPRRTDLISQISLYLRSFSWVFLGQRSAEHLHLTASLGFWGNNDILGGLKIHLHLFVAPGASFNGKIDGHMWRQFEHIGNRWVISDNENPFNVQQHGELMTALSALWDVNLLGIWTCPLQCWFSYLLRLKIFVWVLVFICVDNAMMHWCFWFNDHGQDYDDTWSLDDNDD